MLEDLNGRDALKTRVGNTDVNAGDDPVPKVRFKRLGTIARCERRQHNTIALQ